MPGHVGLHLRAQLRPQARAALLLLLLAALRPARWSAHALALEREQPDQVKASHKKEQRAKETIHNLKLEINNLSHLVEQGAGLSVDQETPSAVLLHAGGRSAAGGTAAAATSSGGAARDLSLPTVVGKDVGGNPMVTMGLWICVAAIIAVLLFSAYVLMWYAHVTATEPKATDNKVEAIRGVEAILARSAGRKTTSVTRPKSSRTSGTANKAPTSWSSFYTESSRHVPESVRSSTVGTPASRAGVDAGSRRGALPLLPLCPQLIVPDGTRLKCVLQEAVCRRRQDLAFNINGIAAHGGAPLFQIRVVERAVAAGNCGIFVETLGGKEQFAFLSTQELWADEGDLIPKFSIMRPGGLPYASMQKSPQGEYVVRCGQENMMTFSGDFLTHDIQVRGALGQTVGLVGNSSGGEYEVQVNPRSDAGLVVLGLLAIDKCERVSGSPPGSTNYVPVGTAPTPP